MYDKQQEISRPALITLQCYNNHHIIISVKSIEYNITEIISASWSEVLDHVVGAPAGLLEVLDHVPAGLLEVLDHVPAGFLEAFDHEAPDHVAGLPEVLLPPQYHVAEGVGLPG